MVAEQLSCRSKPGRWFASWCAAVFCLGLTACEGASIDPDHDAGTCHVDGDCVAGLTCYDHRVCVATTVADTPIVLRLTPPPDSGLLSEQFAVTLGSAKGQAPKLVLTPPAVVRGTVSQKGNPLARSIPGTLLANAPGLVDGVDLRFDATSLATQKTIAGSALAYGYELRVQAGLTYDVAFWPQSDAFPPHYTTATWGGSIDAWDIELPADSEYLHVKGQIAAAGKGIAKLRVALQDDAGRLCSTHATTDSDGKFDLLVDPSAPTAVTAVLGFEPADAKDLLPHGRVLPPLALKDYALKPGPVDLGAIDVGPLPELVDVTVHVQADGGAAVPEALVQMEHSLLQKRKGPQTFSALFIDVQGYVNAQGDFHTQLPPGAAQVIVQPAQKSPSARTAWQGDLQAGTQVLTCGQRLPVGGAVLDYASRGVAASQVVLRRIDTPDKGLMLLGSSDAGAADPIEIATDKDGAFHALVDPGTYAVWVLPPHGSGLAQVLARVADVAQGGNAADWQLIVPPPALLLGSVLRTDGQAVPGVLVDVLAAHLTLAQAAPVPVPGSLTDSHLLGSAVSDAKGRFEALVVATQVAH